MKNLDAALSKLCEELNTNSEKLGDWLMNDGLPQYANLQIMTNIVWTIVFIMACVACAVIFRYGLKRYKEDVCCDEIIPIMAIVVSGALLFVFVPCAAQSFIEVLSWYLYPDGKIMQVIVSMM
jgi:amino acid transporter